MGSSLPPKCSTTIILSCFLFLLAAAVDAKLVHSQRVLRRPLKEKMSHLHFYFHDIVSGRNPTAVTVAGAKNSTSLTGFGDIVMIDDPLTEGPEVSSKLVGRAQGLYALAGLQELSLLMAVNYVFMEGKYNGSSLSILGRNMAMRPVREMAVVGGSGLFRMARGYAVAKTHWFDANTGDATVEYNVYVVHY
ncbi:Dirigent protein 23 [Nymphaea thermarum]|nr:Dirigent protein 23 [Nymphaea thermarum]